VPLLLILQLKRSTLTHIRGPKSSNLISGGRPESMQRGRSTAKVTSACLSLHFSILHRSQRCFVQRSHHGAPHSPRHQHQRLFQHPLPSRANAHAQALHPDPSRKVTHHATTSATLFSPVSQPTTQLSFKAPTHASYGTPTIRHSSPPTPSTPTSSLRIPCRSRGTGRVCRMTKGCVRFCRMMIGGAGEGRRRSWR
jgi:hypothetical protein